MSVVFSSECIECHLRRNLETARRLGTEEQATAFARELMKLYLSAPEGVGSPWFGPATTDLFHEMYGLDLDRYKQEKADSNRFVLDRLDQIRARVENAQDPVYAGLQFSVLGNYIDFSALQGQVSFAELDSLLDRAEEMTPTGDGYAHLCADLGRAHNRGVCAEDCIRTASCLQLCKSLLLDCHIFENSFDDEVSAGNEFRVNICCEADAR